MKKFLKAIYIIFRGFVRLISLVFLVLMCRFIKFISGEKDKEGQITARKARRIRLFTNIKIFIGNHCLWLAKFFGNEKYIIDVNRRLGYGM